MARINSLLAIVVDQGANELRIGSEGEPSMFAFGVRKRLTIPKMSDATVRDLLGEILSADREKALARDGRLDVAYDGAGLGIFQVTLTAQDTGGIGAVFINQGAAKPTRKPEVDSVRDPPAGASQPLRPGTEAAPNRTMPNVGQRAPRTLDAIVRRASSVRASDVHLADGEIPFVRVDGVLRRLDEEPPSEVASLLELGESDLDLLARNRSLDMGMDVAGMSRIRIHVYTATNRLIAAIRLLPPAPPSLADLNMPSTFDDLVALPNGLVLICGATGSGKSTTLAALASEALSRRSIMLVTLEDPIEYPLVAPKHSVVRQRQVGRDVPTFACGLRDALREDPDVLLVGELRDPETIALALTAAETGHLVLASLHSQSAASAIGRIFDAYPPERQQQIRSQLADGLRSVIAQRLVPRAQGPGRLPAIEVLRVTHAVANVIREGRTAQIATILQSGRRDGMISLERCLADRVQANEIRLEDARAAANDADSLGIYLTS